MSERFQERKQEDVKTITTFQLRAAELHNMIHYSLASKLSLKTIYLYYIAAPKCFNFFNKTLLMLHIDETKT